MLGYKRLFEVCAVANTFAATAESNRDAGAVQHSTEAERETTTSADWAIISCGRGRGVEQLRASQVMETFIPPAQRSHDGFARATRPQLIFGNTALSFATHAEF